LDGKSVYGRPRRTFLSQIELVLEKGLVKSTQNRRVAIRNLKKVEEAQDMRKNRSTWKELISAYPYGKWA
jgi:hypothetical protein